MATLAAEHTVPVENLLQPDLLRRLCWSPPDALDADSIGAVLAAGGARPWQVALTSPVLAKAMVTDE